RRHGLHRRRIECHLPADGRSPRPRGAAAVSPLPYGARHEVRQRLRAMKGRPALSGSVMRFDPHAVKPRPTYDYRGLDPLEVLASKRAAYLTHRRGDRMPAAASAYGEARQLAVSPVPLPYDRAPVALGEAA